MASNIFTKFPGPAGEDGIKTPEKGKRKTKKTAGVPQRTTPDRLAKKKTSTSRPPPKTMEPGHRWLLIQVFKNKPILWSRVDPKYYMRANQCKEKRVAIKCLFGELIEGEKTALKLNKVSRLVFSTLGDETDSHRFAHVNGKFTSVVNSVQQMIATKEANPKKIVAPAALGPYSKWEPELEWLKQCMARDNYGKGPIMGEKILCDVGASNEDEVDDGNEADVSTLSEVEERPQRQHSTPLYPPVTPSRKRGPQPPSVNARVPGPSIAQAYGEYMAALMRGSARTIGINEAVSINFVIQGRIHAGFYRKKTSSVDTPV